MRLSVEPVISTVKSFSSRFSTGNWIALIAVIVTGLGIWIGYEEYQTYTEFQRKEVRPRLVVVSASGVPFAAVGNTGRMSAKGTYRDSTTGYAILLRNVGPGRALLDRTILMVDGKPMKNWFEALAALGYLRDMIRWPEGNPFYISTPSDEPVILPNHGSFLLWFPENWVDDFALNMDRVSWILCYESVYGDMYSSWIRPPKGYNTNLEGTLSVDDLRSTTDDLVINGTTCPVSPDPENRLNAAPLVEEYKSAETGDLFLINTPCRFDPDLHEKAIGRRSSSYPANRFYDLCFRNRFSRLR